MTLDVKNKVLKGIIAVLWVIALGQVVVKFLNEPNFQYSSVLDRNELRPGKGGGREQH